MIVIEYGTKFDRLAKFASSKVANEVLGKEKFIRGLKEHIVGDVIVTTNQPGVVRSYAQVVELALIAEGAKNQKKSSIRRDSWKPPSITSLGRGFDPSDQKRKPNDPSYHSFYQGGKENWRTYSKCPWCRRQHMVHCQARACFQCGVVDHLKRNCTQLQKLDTKKEDTIVPARLFALTQAEADAGPSTVTGQTSIDGNMFTVLIDFGAMNSYVSSRVINSLSRPHDVLSNGFGTLLLTGELVISNVKVKSLNLFR
uniref:CCHC-type domain-containing protein n=1 Tax=Cannabis sativa TaxID=3483 RepID=A0A803QEF3_CANSA